MDKDKTAGDKDKARSSDKSKAPTGGSASGQGDKKPDTNRKPSGGSGGGRHS